MAKYLERIDVYNPAHNAIVNLRPAHDILAEAAKRDEQLSRGSIWAGCMGCRRP
jgi:Asp-tRNA(Asn)/Glu-tRNA(Gln) amidotransferase A subunit family amidase